MAINIIDVGLRFNGNHANRQGAPKGILLHHAAGDGSVEQIHRIHQNRGYAGIGYHIYIRRDGKVYRGRPEAWLGAHATGFNDRIGVCAEGNFEAETMSSAQQQAIVEVLRYLLQKYGNLSIEGHRDVAATACPGKNYPQATIVRAAKAATPNTPVNGFNPLVKAFQQACLVDGVSVGTSGADGLWGPDTERAADRILVRGSKGDRVRAMQKRLKDLRFDVGGNGADGDYGKDTEKAVNAFKKSINLPQNGRVGIKVWRALLGV